MSQSLTADRDGCSSDHEDSFARTDRSVRVQEFSSHSSGRKKLCRGVSYSLHFKYPLLLCVYFYAITISLAMRMPSHGLMHVHAPLRCHHPRTSPPLATTEPFEDAADTEDAQAKKLARLKEEGAAKLLQRARRRLVVQEKIALVRKNGGTPGKPGIMMAPPPI